MQLKILILMIMLMSQLVVARAEEPQQPAPVDSVIAAIKQGKINFSLRYRFEGVDQADIPKNANASTLRTRFGYGTATFSGLKGYFEIEDVQVVGNDLYNDTINGKTEYPVVADPDGTEVNQAYLNYEFMPGTSIRGGRRQMVLDDARFIGDVDWRQNSQTYDGVDLVSSGLMNTKLYYGWMYQVNRVFGEDSPNDKYNSQLHLFNVNHTLGASHLTGFTYLLDLDNSDTSSSASYGFRFDGIQDLSSNLKLIYDTSYAYQQDYADNPEDIQANYIHALLGLGFDPVTVAGGIEVLGSDDGASAFQTPLATLHKFNGWADKFLVTPDTGLEDAYARVSFKMDSLGSVFRDSVFSTIFHDFNSNQDSLHYGTEWDFLWTKKINTEYELLLKYASYNAIDYSVDTEKVWVSLSANFNML